MSAQEIHGDWYVVDSQGNDFDGPYPTQADAEVAARDFEDWHRIENRDRF
jgi:hypothetical protein